MKSVFRSVVFGFAVVSLLGVTTASAASKPVVRNAAINFVSTALEGDISVRDVAKVGVHIAAEAAAVPVAISGASTLGVAAGTGTAISSLSGAAAVSATSAAIGAPVATAIGAATGIVVAPAVVGLVVISGVAGGLAYGFNVLFLDEEDED